MPRLTKRALLLCAASLAALPSVTRAAGRPVKVEPFPLEAVTLTPSIWLDAVNANSNYLKSLIPDRFLHNFRKSAGLAPKGDIYGGWENMGIAGHSLGHYLTACALSYGGTRDPVFRERLAYTVAEMAAIQAAHGDGYIGGTTVERDGKILDGKIVFEEVRAHTITSHGFDLNGGWVPLYTWHKVHAGLLDAHRYTGNAQALDVAVKMSDYLIGVLGGLSEDEMQKVLSAEHGGLNETFAETYVRTGETRFLDMSRRIYHKAILAPLAEGRDELEGKHANTQIPKLIGLARLFEITGDTGYRDTAGFFWDRVVHHHSYVIGGNSDGEHFGAPDKLSGRLDDKTCESCNSYNMLKLTRHLYQWQPDSTWFDFYERAHLNHIMAHQDPATGRFVYFVPLSSGSQRIYSTPTESFWCCVGSGMESHAKHGDSIWWRSNDTLFLNLFIPSDLDWTDKKTKVALTGDVVNQDTLTVRVTPQTKADFTLAIRLPAWAHGPRISVNGAEQPLLLKNGYAHLKRIWRPGDSVTVILPRSVQVELMPDNPKLAAFVRGPLVLAADMGPAEGEIPPAPVVVATDALSSVDAALTLASQPTPLSLKPFFSQYHRRTAVYFPLYSEAEWQVRKASYAAEEVAKRELAARTIDVMTLGEMQPERDHAFATDIAEVSSRLGRSGRWLMWTTGKFFEFDLGVDPAGTVLQVTYWGQDVGRNFDITVDGQLLKNETLSLPSEQNFRILDYPVPAGMLTGKSKVRIRFTTRGTGLDVFEVRALRPTVSPERSSA